MPETDLVRCERHGEWAELILNRPDKGNALTMPMLEALGSCAAEFARDRELRVVVLRGDRLHQPIPKRSEAGGCMPSSMDGKP